MKMYQQGELDPLIKERKLRPFNGGGETETIRTKAANDLKELSDEITRLRAQDEAIRAYFGGKRDGRDTIEILKEAFHAKWSEEDTLVEAMLDHKTAELKAEIERLRAALESIADLPPGYADMKQDDLVVILANKARAVLAGSPPAEQEKPNE